MLKTRYYSGYIELTIQEDNTTIVTGFLDKAQALPYLEELRGVVEELEEFTKED